MRLPAGPAGWEDRGYHITSMLFPELHGPGQLAESFFFFQISVYVHTNKLIFLIPRQRINFTCQRKEEGKRLRQGSRRKEDSTVFQDWRPHASLKSTLALNIPILQRQPLNRPPVILASGCSHLRLVLSHDGVSFLSTGYKRLEPVSWTLSFFSWTSLCLWGKGC